MFYSLKVVNIKVEYIGKLLLCNFRFEREKNVLILLNVSSKYIFVCEISLYSDE